MASTKKRKTPKKKGPKWVEDEYGIVKRWTTRNGERVTLRIDGRRLDKTPVELPPEPRRRKSATKKRKKGDLSDVPF